MPDRASTVVTSLMRHLPLVTTVYLDFETRSTLDISKTGGYRYAWDSTTSVLCLGYSVNGRDPQLWVPGMPIPQIFYSDSVVFVAHNVQFDRLIFDRFIHKTRIEQWDDTMIRCLYHGLPGGLDDVAKHVFKQAKDKRGHQLITARNGKGVCMPQKQTKTKNRPEKIYWNNNPEDLQALYEYCIQDVRLLITLDKSIPSLPEIEQRAWWTFERMNDNGVGVDLTLCENAVRVTAEQRISNEARIPKLTNGLIQTSGQIAAIVAFVNEIMGPDTMTNCQAGTLDDMLLRHDLPPNVRELLSIRQTSNSAAVKKYQAALDRACEDGRVRGATIFYGAHTGRSTSKGVQLQNSKRGKEKQYLGYLEALSRGDLAPFSGWVDWNYHLSTGVRRLFVAREGRLFVVDDYAGIEARVVDWLVGDEDGLQRYRDKIDEYIILAASICGVSQSDVTDHQRSIGKEARLSGQYGIGGKGYHRRLNIKWGIEISEDEAEVAITTFRRDKWRVVQAWSDIRRAWRSACVGIPTYAVKCLFSVENNWMRITSPDGRSLYYYAPSHDMSYGVVGQTMESDEIETEPNADPHKNPPPPNKKAKKKKVMLRKNNYGGATLENIAQWISGNISRDDMVEIDRQQIGDLCFMVHDEFITEVDAPHAVEAQQRIEQIMTTSPWWAPDLPLAAEGWIGPHYKKG